MIFYVIIAIDDRFLERLITDLTLKGLSLNKIREHIQFIYCFDISKNSIKNIQNNAGKKANVLNQHFDKLIAAKISTAEADETFQGKNNLIFGAVDKKSSYLFGLQYAINRMNKTLCSFLKPISKRFFNIRVVITDLFKGYKKEVQNIFPKARHLQCHIHARRIVMRLIKKLQSYLSHRKHELERILLFLQKNKKKISLKSTECQKKTKRIKKDRQLLINLKKIKKAKNPGRTKTLDKKMDIIQSRLQKLYKKVSILTKELVKLRKRRDQLKKDERKIKTIIKKANINLLQSSRLANEFYRLMSDMSPKFETHMQKFLNKLKNSSYPFATTLKKFIQNNPQIFSLRKRRDLRPNFQNTNRIEGIFGLLRPLLDSTRLLNTPEGTNMYCNLFRLYHNTTPPYTGINNHQSPLERLGVSLHGKNYLDFLFPKRKRVTHFLIFSDHIKTKMGWNLRAIDHPMCECLL
jgi:hypothetical protein